MAASEDPSGGTILQELMLGYAIAAIFLEWTHVGGFSPGAGQPWRTSWFSGESIDLRGGGSQEGFMEKDETGVARSYS